MRHHCQHKTSNNKTKRVAYALALAWLVACLYAQPAFAAKSEADSLLTGGFTPRGSLSALPVEAGNNDAFGFSVSGSYSSTPQYSAGNGASLELGGHDLLTSLTTDQLSAQSNHAWDVAAMTLDGRYDFSLGSALNPFLTSGVGVAVFDNNSLINGQALANGSGSTVPVFRVGGGVNLQLDQSWDFSLRYRASFIGANDASRSSITPSRQPQDMQLLDIGLKYRF